MSTVGQKIKALKKLIKQAEQTDLISAYIDALEAHESYKRDITTPDTDSFYPDIYKDLKDALHKSLHKSVHKSAPKEKDKLLMAIELHGHSLSGISPGQKKGIV